MTNAVTVLAHRRPHYLRKTLDALARCDGIEEWRVRLVLDRPDPGTAALASRCPWEVILMDLHNDADPPYSRASRATLMALSLGFATADYVAHLEEDVVPSSDFLTWHTGMADLYRADPRVFTVSAWWGSPPEWSSGLPEGVLAGFGLAAHFVPWGFGLWRDRFEELRAKWSFEFWDRHLNEVVRGDRLTVHPLVARVRDIGEQGGVNDAAEWRERQRRDTPVVKEDQ